MLLAGRDGLTHEHLVQALAHELAVYLDSKANPAASDAAAIPELRDLQVFAAGGPAMDPMVAISDPFGGAHDDLCARPSG